jgi:hypothetical protein
MTPKEKADDIINYIRDTHLKQYGKIQMKYVLEEALENSRLIIKNRIIDGLDVTYWREVVSHIKLRQ